MASSPLHPRLAVPIHHPLHHRSPALPHEPDRRTGCTVRPGPLLNDTTPRRVSLGKKTNFHASVRAMMRGPYSENTVSCSTVSSPVQQRPQRKPSRPDQRPQPRHFPTGSGLDQSTLLTDRAPPAARLWDRQKPAALAPLSRSGTRTYRLGDGRRGSRRGPR